MSDRLANGAIADLLDRHGQLLQVAGESPFRSRAYTRAAESLRIQPEHLVALAAEGRLREIPGIGPGIAAAIEQILETGSFADHTDLTSRFPESLVAITALPGIGARTAQRLYRGLGIDSLAALEAALDAGQIRETKGLGARLEATIRSGMDALQRRTGRTPLGIANPIAQSFIAAFRIARPEDTISLAGSARRWDVTVGDLDFLIASSDLAGAMAAIDPLPTVTSFEQTSELMVRVSLAGEIEADVFFTDPASWGSALVRATGNARHLERLGAIPDRASTEDEVYATHGLPWIPPELRTGHDEFERWQEIPDLVTRPDIHGEFHAHTTWSDGAATIHEMAQAAAGREYTFLGITDHSHGLGIAGGLDAERLSAQRRELVEIDGVQGVKLLAGSEVEAHRDGTLDFDDEPLAGLDVVIASLHSGLRQSRADITNRLVRVLENPHVDIIAHPSGRLIERREGGDFDWDRVFNVAAKTGTALEINADPARLDLDPNLAQRASVAGCLITVNCDAHSPTGFSAMDFGVAMARKAWLKPEQILNCWPRQQVLDWLASRGNPH